MGARLNLRHDIGGRIQDESFGLQGEPPRCGTICLIVATEYCETVEPSQLQRWQIQDIDMGDAGRDL